MSEKKEILDYIETNKYSYIEISDRIHDRHELGNEEIFASRILIDRLNEHDFEIET
ncbi:amidohydrolase, partial [Staphylococcus aureus]|nr:amidohydrolase [Staphylococcus aureus]